MFKYMVLIMVLGQLSQAQKSFYAGSQAYYPKVLAKYRTTTTTTTDSLVNRVGDNTVSVGPESTQATMVEESEFDRNNRRIASWPIDKQPFSYRNREVIQAWINRGVDGGNFQQPSGNKLNTNMRSPFAGARG